MFTAEERAIYVYHDGERERRADPLAIRRAILRAAGGDIEGLVEAALTEDQSPITEGMAPGERGRRLLRQAEAQERLAEVVRVAFGLKAFDPETGGGCTEEMVWRVWDHFHEYMEGNGSGGAN